ncbi:MAG: hypothetical protein EXS31_05795 [Pedosphaera sp.]|nr:hypothetical protein [Pedosphaera sp.]
MKTGQLKIIAIVLALITSLFAGCELQTTGAQSQVPKKVAATTGEAAAAAVAAPAGDESKSETPAPKKLSDSLEELVKLAERGLGDELLIAWVNKSSEPFKISPDEIVYLSDLGISEPVIKALIEHKGTVAIAAAPVPQSAPTAPPNTAIAGALTNPIAPPATTIAPSASISATPEFDANPKAPPAPAPEQPVTYVQQPAPVQMNYFYSSMAPYGSWIEVADYGLCWRPTVAVVDTSWRPYCHGGRWLYTNCGWYWQSDYSWGWAPFHYGRWHRHHASGWVWAPDPVWSPAWVTWRYSSSHCGWAPLPPGSHYSSGVGLTFNTGGVSGGFGFGFGYDHYTFLPSRRFCDPQPWRHRLPPHQAAGIYNNTTVINNITVNSNNTLVNEGPGRERISAMTRSEIRKVNLRDVPAENVKTIRSDRLEKGGTELAVYRPLNPTLPVNARTSIPRSEISKSSVTASPRGIASETPRRPQAQTIVSTRNPGAPAAFAPVASPLRPSASLSGVASSSGIASQPATIPSANNAPASVASTHGSEARSANTTPAPRNIRGTAVPVFNAPTPAATPVNPPQPSIVRSSVSSSQKAQSPINPAARYEVPTPPVSSARVSSVPGSKVPSTSSPLSPAFTPQAMTPRSPAPQSITPPLVSQQPVNQTRPMITTPSPVITAPAARQEFSAPAPSAGASRNVQSQPTPGYVRPTQPGYAQPAQTIRSTPQPGGSYDARQPIPIAPRTAPQQNSYVPAPAIRSAPSAPPPAQGYSTPRSAPQPVTSTPSSSSQGNNRSGDRERK